MNQYFSKLIIILSLISMAGCFVGSNELEIFGQNKVTQGAGSKVSVTSVSIVNNQLLLTGNKLAGATSVEITGPSGFNETFTIESQDNENLVANGLRNVSFLIGSIFNLVISDANGASTYLVTYTLNDGAVTASKLDSMGASVGQILRYNGTNWVAGDLSSLTFAGNWDANLNLPDITGGGSIGEYYLVSDAGTTDLEGGPGTNNWSIGDWVVWNNVFAQWEKVDNATNVQNFNGRSGVVIPSTDDYTWEQINKSNSFIGDIANVDNSAASNGDVLKWDGAYWAPASDLTGGAGSGSVTEVSAGTGLTGGPITTTGTLNVDVGTTDGKIAQVGAGDVLPSSIIPEIIISMIANDAVTIALIGTAGGTDANKSLTTDAAGDPQWVA
ncbi:MAG: hypothetical protein HOI53_04725, partial [Francisellaceae bacterium]|nr:hypothetical protein [Francisellaceae bacterium]